MHVKIKVWTHFPLRSDLLVLECGRRAAASWCMPRLGLWKRSPLRRSSFCFMAGRLLHSWTNLSTCGREATPHIMFAFNPRLLEPSSLLQIDSSAIGAALKARKTVFFLPTTYTSQFSEYIWVENKQFKNDTVFQIAEQNPSKQKNGAMYLYIYIYILSVKYSKKIPWQYSKYGSEHQGLMCNLPTYITTEECLLSESQNKTCMETQWMCLIQTIFYLLL